MRCVVVLTLLAILSACGDSSKGDSSTGGVVIDCTPGETFCQGDNLWRCTYTGRDASHLADCAAASVNNPQRCVSNDPACGTASYPLNKACCR